MMNVERLHVDVLSCTFAHGGEELRHSHMTQLSGPEKCSLYIEYEKHAAQCAQ